MSTLTVYDMKGGEVGGLDVDAGLLVTDRGEEALRDVLRAYQAGQRAGTASTLSKGEVAGSNKKPWRQKGTGRARAGYRQSPVWRGGAVAFGPHPRSYAVKVNRKVARLAFRRALSERIVEGAVKVVDALAASEPKTRPFAELLKGLGVNGPALIVLEGRDANVERSARNLDRVEVVTASDVHAYHLVRYPAIVASRGAMKILEARLGANGEAS